MALPPRLLLGAFVVLLAAGPAPGGPLSGRTPAEGPSSAVLGSWKKFDGTVRSKWERVDYALSVNPARTAIYEVTRYRITHLTSSGQGTSETEKFLWNAHPGAHNALRCFELADGRWSEMPAGSPEYRREMGSVLYVYGLYRHSLGLDPVGEAKQRDGAASP